MLNAMGRNAKQIHRSLGNPSKKCFLPQNSIAAYQETLLNLIGLPFTETYRSMEDLLAFVGLWALNQLLLVTFPYRQ